MSKLKKKYPPRRPFEEVVQEIRNTLEQGLPIKGSDKHWLHRKRKYFENSPDVFSDREIQLLDSLNPLLGHSWKISRVQKVFEDKYLKVIKALEDNSTIDRKTQKWLFTQKRQFLIKNPRKIPTDRYHKLLRLQSLLGDAWKVPKKTIIKNSTDIPDRREVIKKWFMETAPFLNFASVERSCNIPRGMLQKVHRYDYKIRYEWVDALENFKNEFSRY